MIQNNGILSALYEAGFGRKNAINNAIAQQQQQEALQQAQGQYGVVTSTNSQDPYAWVTYKPWKEIEAVLGNNQTPMDMYNSWDDDRRMQYIARNINNFFPTMDEDGNGNGFGNYLSKSASYDRIYGTNEEAIRRAKAEDELMTIYFTGNGW